MITLDFIRQEVSNLKREKGLPKKFRDSLGLLYLGSEPDGPLGWSHALTALRTLMEVYLPTIPEPKRAMLSAWIKDLEINILREGFDPGQKSEESDKLFLRLQTGCWIQDGAAPLTSSFVLGGFMTEEFYKPKLTTPPSTGLSFSRRVTAWDVFLSEHPDEDLCQQLTKVRRALERERLVGKLSGSWTNSHHFVFSNKRTMAFSWRAIGDIQVAILGEGHFMDYYG